MTEEVFDPATIDAGPQLPGQLLRETREAIGLTVGEIASSIKFHPRQIEALERDDYDQLQGKTFLRGFVRAYSRVLQLPSEPLLEMLDRQQVFHEEVVVPPDNMGETNPRPFYLRHARLLFGGLVVIFVAAGLGWAFLKVDLQGWIPKRTPVVAEKSAPNAPEAHEANEVQMNPVAIPDGSTDGAANAAAPEALSAVAADPAQGATLSATAAAPAMALEFEFSALSWLEVKDAAGRVLITGEFPAGKKQGISGKPPYDLWIGKASAVKVTYKGQAVDVIPYAHDEVARFTLN